jgi:hypothetical protein
MSILLSSTLANESTSYYALAGAGAGGVDQITAGLGVTITPSGGTGNVNVAVPGAMITGMIVMYNGGVSPPTGWAFCDGTNGTPDLRDRFVIQASGTHLFNSSGGSATATLGLTNLPDHIHGGAAVLGSGGTAGINDYNVTGLGGNTTGISSVGWTSPQPFSVENPYYVLAFIMKL